jgi:hypothetical protein
VQYTKDPHGPPRNPVDDDIGSLVNDQFARAGNPARAANPGELNQHIDLLFDAEVIPECRVAIIQPDLAENIVAIFQCGC